MTFFLVEGMGGGEGFISHEDEVLINGISAFIKEDPESCFVLLTKYEHSEKVPSMSKEMGPHETPNVPSPWTS
jgi:hypothetical protein